MELQLQHVSLSSRRARFLIESQAAQYYLQTYLQRLNAPLTLSLSAARPGNQTQPAGGPPGFQSGTARHLDLSTRPGLSMEPVPLARELVQCRDIGARRGYQRIGVCPAACDGLAVLFKADA